ncbi:hypothetical protein OIE78_34670 (plasmid) [Streptomyces cellulosae]|uniref:hypothetical protein n=1 Tax=Streptomyces cellulosae TaxID=1968 RepID=UPI002F916814|nr:hypothetical protein OG837_35545 [Streptomyces cellulosae]
MAVIAFSGASGGPGATTTALAALLTWPLRDGRRVVLAECDPDGGSIAAGYLESRVMGDMGLHHLQVADRRGHLERDFWPQLINLSEPGAEDRVLLPGLIDPAQAAGLHQTWPRLGAFFAERLQHPEPHRPAYDVLIDLGRSGATGAANALARSADITAVVVRRTLRSTHAAKPRVQALRAMLEMHGREATRLGLIVIDEGPYSARDIAEKLELPVFAELPFDPKAAQVLTHGGDGGRGFGKSQLLRAAAVMSDKLQGLAVQEQQRLHAPALRPLTALDRLRGGTR